MKGKILLLLCFATVNLFAQDSTTTTVDTSKVITPKKNWSNHSAAKEVFYGQRLINAKTVEVLKKGVMAFTVVHTFGDIA
ncbi:MAG TPA: hypothetical protein VGI82_13565, partial [Chitinophagaceae bacterium]